MAEEVAVTVPVYRRAPDECDAAALRQCVSVLGGHPLILFMPESLDAAPWLALSPKAAVKRFDDRFFASVAGYSSLMLSPFFYEHFTGFGYILVHQLDAWVFRDELTDWCRRGYEYVGAPFFITDGRGRLPVVGNGGLSLRKVSAMKRVLSETGGRMFPPELLKLFFRNHWTSGNYAKAFFQLLRIVGSGNRRGKIVSRMRRDGDNEDMVLGYLNRRFVADGLVTPDVREAAHFALDMESGYFFANGGGRMPFGIHGWNRPDRVEFLKERGIELRRQQA